MTENKETVPKASEQLKINLEDTFQCVSCGNENTEVVTLLIGEQHEKRPNGFFMCQLHCNDCNTHWRE